MVGIHSIDALWFIAEAVKISTTTAFHWRHKVIEAMREYKEEILLKGEIQVDETYFLLNMKGKWSDKSALRPSKKRGTPAIRRGINQEHVCVLIAIGYNLKKYHNKKHRLIQ